MYCYCISKCDLEQVCLCVFANFSIIKSNSNFVSFRFNTCNITNVAIKNTRSCLHCSIIFVFNKFHFIVVASLHNFIANTEFCKVVNNFYSWKMRIYHHLQTLVKIINATRPCFHWCKHLNFLRFITKIFWKPSANHINNCFAVCYQIFSIFIEKIFACIVNYWHFAVVY